MDWSHTGIPRPLFQFEIIPKVVIHITLSITLVSLEEAQLALAMRQVLSLLKPQAGGTGNGARTFSRTDICQAYQMV